MKALKQLTVGLMVAALIGSHAMAIHLCSYYTHTPTHVLLTALEGYVTFSAGPKAEATGPSVVSNDSEEILLDPVQSDNCAPSGRRITIEKTIGAYNDTVSSSLTGDLEDLESSDIVYMSFNSAATTSGAVLQTPVSVTWHNDLLGDPLWVTGRSSTAASSVAGTSFGVYEDACKKYTYKFYMTKTTVTSLATWSSCKWVCEHNTGSHASGCSNADTASATATAIKYSGVNPGVVVVVDCPTGGGCPYTGS